MNATFTTCTSFVSKKCLKTAFGVQFSLMWCPFSLSSGVWRSRIYKIPGSSHRAGLHVRQTQPLLSLFISQIFLLMSNTKLQLISWKPCAPRCVVFRVKSRSSTPSQHHLSAAKDLTNAAEPASASSPSATASPTYLTSALQQRSKKPRHFLELKNFKDNYNTLDSTF